MLASAHACTFPTSRGQPAGTTDVDPAARPPGRVDRPAPGARRAPGRAGQSPAPARGRAGLRPARGVPMREVDSAEAVVGAGLAGDRYKGGSGKRDVTLLQAEHLPVIAALAGHDAVAPATLRRNLVVSGIPLVALKGRRF